MLQFIVTPKGDLYTLIILRKGDIYTNYNHAMTLEKVMEEVKNAQKEVIW